MSSSKGFKNSYIKLSVPLLYDLFSVAVNDMVPWPCQAFEKKKVNSIETKKTKKTVF